MDHRLTTSQIIRQTAVSVAIIVAALTALSVLASNVANAGIRPQPQECSTTKHGVEICKAVHRSTLVEIMPLTPATCWGDRLDLLQAVLNNALPTETIRYEQQSPPLDGFSASAWVTFVDQGKAWLIGHTLKSHDGASKSCILHTTS